jgi:hypothetical protein
MDRNPVNWEDFNVYRRPGLITLLWRWRTEIMLIVALVGLEYLLTKVMGLITCILVGYSGGPGVSSQDTSYTASSGRLGRPHAWVVYRL